MKLLVVDPNSSEDVSIRAEERQHGDCVVATVFRDPRKSALKELVVVPVGDIAMAALSTAELQSMRSSRIAISSLPQAGYRAGTNRDGVRSRLAPIRSLTDPLTRSGSVRTDFEDTPRILSEAAVAEGSADHGSWAGVSITGRARKFGRSLPLPIVGGISAGAKPCEPLVDIGCRIHRAGTLACPPILPNEGLTAGMARTPAAGKERE